MKTKTTKPRSRTVRARAEVPAAPAGQAQPTAPEPAPGVRRLVLPARDALPTRIEFQFAPSFLRRLLTGSPAPTARLVRESREDYGHERLLHSEMMQVDARSVWVQAWLIDGRSRGRYHIRVQLSSDKRLRRTLRAVLTWDGHEYFVELVRGQAAFEDITTPDFSGYAPDEPVHAFSITFEID